MEDVDYFVQLRQLTNRIIEWVWEKNSMYFAAVGALPNIILLRPDPVERSRSPISTFFSPPFAKY